MPSKRPYPPEHYPESYFNAVKQAVGQADTWFTAATAQDSKEAARVHTKVKALLKHVETFAGQDPKIVDAVRNKRLHIRKDWDAKAKVIYIKICLYGRPSEEFEHNMQEYLAGRRSTPF